MRVRREHLLVIVPFAVLAWVVTFPFRDNAVLWHIRAGELQTVSATVLTTDPFSVSHGGMAWRTQSWLVDLLYAWLERWGSVLAWAPLLTFTVTAVTILAIGLASWMGSKSVAGAGLRMVVGVAVLAPFVAARPTVFSYALLAVLVVVLKVERLWWIGVPLLWVWASVHGSFPVGLGLMLLTAVTLRSRKLFVIAVASATTIGLGAHGLGIFEIMGAFLTNREALSVIQEWQRPDLLNPFLMPFLVVLLGVALAFVRGGLRPRDGIVLAPFVLSAFAAQRNLPHAAIVLLAASALRRGSAGRSEQSADSRYVSVAERSTVGVALVAIVVLAVVGLVRPVEWSIERFPSTQVTDALTPQETFSDLAVGGYLIYRFWPQHPAFVDDRAELFGPKIIDVSLASDGDTRVLDAYDLQMAIVKRSDPLAAALTADGWNVRARDEKWLLLAREGP